MSYKIRKPWVIVPALIILFPFALLLMLSFGREWRYPSLLPSIFTIENWRVIFSSGSGLAQSLILSLIISASVALVSTAAGFMTSKYIAGHRRGNTLMFLSFLPFILPPVIYAATVYFYFIRLHLAGTVAGVIIGQLLIAFPYSIILFSGFWNHRLRAMQDLVHILGGNTYDTYLRVFIPMARGMLMISLFQTFLISWFEYGLTSIIGVGAIQTLTLKVFQYVGEANIFYAALSCCLLILPPAVMLYFNKRYLLKKHI